MADETTRAVLTAAYIEVAKGIIDRRLRTEQLRTFSKSLQWRQPVPIKRTAAGRLHEPVKRFPRAKISIGLSGDPQRVKMLEVSRGSLTAFALYQKVKQQEWCPSYPFKLLCGEKVLHADHEDCKNAIFGDARGLLYLVQHFEDAE